MKYLPVPIELLQVGQPLPVTLYSASGQMLLRKGNEIVSEQHRERLAEHRASTTMADGVAWQRAYERMIHTRLRDGMPVEEVARLGMPTELRESDYAVARQASGGWPDLQELLRGILYHGGLALDPLPRLESIAQKAAQLLKADADDSLFCMFQMLADSFNGYCATHALLCASICHLTATRLGMEPAHAELLFNSAMTMNISMARDQDSMVVQSNEPTDWQRELIREHPRLSAELLVSLGVDDQAWLDIVRYHHGDPLGQAQAATEQHRRILNTVDVFVAKMAARKTRAAYSPVGVFKDMVIGAEGDALGVSSAMALAIGFYPPGTYVRLASGSTAVVIRRGQRANTPWVVPMVDKEGMPTVRYQPLDTGKPEHAITATVNSDQVRVTVNLDKIRSTRERLPRLDSARA